MASPVKDAKNKVQAQFPGASVHSRGKGWIKHQHPTETNRFIYQTQVGNRGWHFGNGPFDESHEVDTAWVVSSGQWDYEVTKNDFHSYIRDSVPVSYRYVAAETGHYVEITFNSIEWVNDEGASEGAAQFSQVTPVIDDDKIKWPDIAAGWDVEIQAQTGRLAKWLYIDSLANLGSPAIGGTNIRLQIQLTYQKSRGLEVWVDGVKWGEKNNTWVETAGDIEFRDETTQQPIFYFENPHGYDSSDPEVGIAPMVQRVRRTGANFYIEIDTPWSWLQSAVFPISLDATVNPQVGASGKDGREASNQVVSLTAGNYTFNQVDEQVAAQWIVNVAKGVTVNTAYSTWWVMTADDPNNGVDVEIEDADSSANLSSSSGDISSRTYEANGVLWPGFNIGTSQWQNTPSIVTTVENVLGRGGWSSGSQMTNRLYHNGGGSSSVKVEFYDGDSAHGPLLYIDYTSGASPQTVTLDALTLASSVPSASVVATVTVPLDALTLASSVPSASLTLGATTVTVNALTLAGSVPSLSVVPGGVTATLDALTLASSVPSLTVTPGEATVTLDALTLASSIPNLSVTGDVLINLDTLILASTLLNLSITRGAKKALKGGWPFWRF